MAIVPVSGDVFVVFGYSNGRVPSVLDEELVELARYASDALVEVAPAKRLADELEALNAINDLLHAPAETFHQALQHLVDQATVALSCELGVAYIPERQRVSVCDLRESQQLDASNPDLLRATAEIASREAFPVCVQRAEVEDLPAPFRSADGIVAYYLLELRRPLPGILVLLHTRASAPRGFTLLCQSLGLKLVEAAEPLLAGALLRDSMRAELERAAAEARCDPLTGLANRLAWNERLTSTRASQESPASIIQLDCNGLKLINDTYGHGVGDELLRRVAQVLRASVRDDDLVARLGGDEFGILLHNGDEELARALIRRIEGELANAQTPDDPEVRLAIGMSTARDDDLDAARERADAEMLEAKRHSRRVPAPRASA